MKYTISRFALSYVALFFGVLACVSIAPTAFASATLTISSLTPTGDIPVNTPVTFNATPVGFTSPLLTIEDDAMETLTPYLNPFGAFSWTPIDRDIGVHNITITATDLAGNKASVTQKITVIKPSMSIGGLSASAVYVGTPVSFQVSSVGFSSPSYWLGDSFGGGTVSNSRLSSSGSFSWVPVFSDIGTHKLDVQVSDRYGHFAEAFQDIVVSTAPTPTVQSISPGTTTPVGGAVTFSVTSPGFTSPTFSVRDQFSPSTVTTDCINSSGTFTWTPVKSQVGTHLIKVIIRDSHGLYAEVAQTIVVEDGALSLSGFTTGDSVVVGKPMTFIVTAKGLVNPSYTSLDNFPGGSKIALDSISASGLFSWTPTSGEVGVHNITIKALDTYGNAASIHVDVRVAPVATLAPVVPTSTPGTGGAVYVFATNLALGSSGSDVLQLQQFLAQRGFLTATPNGTYGPMTVAAVKKFQSKNGLSPVGAVGPGTRALLNASFSSGATFYFTKPLVLGVSGPEVIELQKRLISLGLYSGVVSGLFDDGTLGAVKKFQALKGLEQIGSIGPSTRAALNAK
jgi:peptidoglycan hydrolase-like protein with peptidoglycan-binding domain